MICETKIYIVSGIIDLPCLAAVMAPVDYFEMTAFTEVDIYTDRLFVPVTLSIVSLKKSPKLRDFEFRMYLLQTGCTKAI